MDASGLAWSYYKSGVLSNCGTTIDHALLAVGWGFDAATNQNYWIVENSWGTSWGQNGYVWIAMTNTTTAGTCGINKDVY